eukprot:scaffold257033_cov31-Tisochrysis_lutea.AAC.1
MSEPWRWTRAHAACVRLAFCVRHPGGHIHATPCAVWADANHPNEGTKNRLNSLATREALHI